MLDVARLAFDHARYQHFAFGHLDRLEHDPLVAVPGIRRLELDRVRLRLPHHVDDVLERNVVVVRPRIVAPAQVHADLLRGNVHERPVERFDVQLHALAKAGEVEISELRVPPHREVRAVDLQRDARGGDGLVLVPHRLGDREDVLFVRPVVVVLEEERGHARRGRGQKTAGRAVCFQRGLQPLGVDARRFHVAHADRPVASGRLAMFPARVRGHAGLGLREGLDVLEHVRRRGGTAEAVQPILDISGVARLSPFAVVDDVDPGLRLFRDRFVDGAAHALDLGGMIHGRAVFAGPHHLFQIVGPRQAADMGSQEAMLAALHRKDDTVARRCLT